MVDKPSKQENNQSIEIEKEWSLESSQHNPRVYISSCFSLRSIHAAPKIHYKQEEKDQNTGRKKKRRYIRRHEAERNELNEREV